ncbi:MAG: hypothetical protein U0237_12530 [Thermoleophilia bacterium]
MPSIAPLVTEYRAYAAGYLAVGAAGAALDAEVRGEAGRSLGTFAVMSVIMLAVLGATNLRWLIGAARDAQAAPADMDVEPPREILRRVALELLFVAALVTLGLAGKSGVGALIAGMAFGTGLVNLAGWIWLTRTEGARRITLYRDTPPRLVAMGRRPIRLRDR